MGLPDVVYTVKQSKDNWELRFSLRSLANLPHGRVWIAGHRPSWCTADHIPTVQGRKKWPNQILNMRAAVEHPDVSDTLVLFNDDFFVTHPLDTVPTLHHGRLVDLEQAQPGVKGEYARRMRDTLAYCGPDALAYDKHHVPMMFDKHRLKVVLDEIGDEMLFRTVYGNRWQVGGRWHPNVKVGMQEKELPPPFVSTSDTSFKKGRIGGLLRRQFPDRSPYER